LLLKPRFPSRFFPRPSARWPISEEMSLRGGAAIFRASSMPPRLLDSPTLAARFNFDCLMERATCIGRPSMWCLGDPMSRGTLHELPYESFTLRLSGGGLDGCVRRLDGSRGQRARPFCNRRALL